MLTTMLSHKIRSLMNAKYREFHYHYSHGSKTFDKILCDSDTSTNLMPLSIFMKIEEDLGVIKSISVSL